MSNQNKLVVTADDVGNLIIEPPHSVEVGETLALLVDEIRNLQKKVDEAKGLMLQASFASHNILTQASTAIGVCQHVINRLEPMYLAGKRVKEILGEHEVNDEDSG